MKMQKVEAESIFFAQEMEKKRIARELHDTTVQNLTAMIHKIEYCTMLVDKDPIETKLELQMMMGTIRSTIDEMRNTIYNLRPMSLDDLKLSEAITNYINHVQAGTECRIYFDIVGEEIELTSLVKLNVFRILQEALGNALRHANPDRVEVKLTYENQMFHLFVKDNGDGFYQDKEKRENSFGLSIMQERAMLMDGEFYITSHPGRGTEVLVDIPIGK